MNMSKAPDKIYVFQHGINAFDPLWHFTESKEKYTESHEYIRKDAILEWAKERLEFAKALRSEGQMVICEELIKHIESL